MGWASSTGVKYVFTNSYCVRNMTGPDVVQFDVRSYHKYGNRHTTCRTSAWVMKQTRRCEKSSNSGSCMVRVAGSGVIL